LAALKTAIEGTALDFTVTDVTGDDPKLLLTQNIGGTAGNSGTILEAGADITVTASFTGGLAATDALIFEFDDNASVTGSNTTVTFGATIATAEAALLAAINASALTLVAVMLGDGSIGLYNTVLSTAGNVTITEAGAAITVTGMAGGAAGTTSVDVQDYIRFQATDGGYGRLSLSHQQGELVRRDKVAVA